MAGLPECYADYAGIVGLQAEGYRVNGCPVLRRSGRVVVLHLLFVAVKYRVNLFGGFSGFGFTLSFGLDDGICRVRFGEFSQVSGSKGLQGVVCSSDLLEAVITL